MAPPDPIQGEAMIRALFDRIAEPKLKWNLNALGLVRAIAVDGDEARIQLNLVTEDVRQIDQFRVGLEAALRTLGYDRARIEIGRVNVAVEGISGIGHVVLVGAGKGGVGKSSIAVNLAVGLAREGARVGLMDADIYGPSAPILLGSAERPQVLPEDYLMPVTAHGVAFMSVGILMPSDRALDWRGGLASGTVLQFIRNTLWGNLDYLVVDLPPGTGDVLLSILHEIKASGALLVTTPQEVALGDVRRALDLFRRCRTPVLGLVENMSFLPCEACGHENHVFPRSNRELVEAEGDDAVSVLSRIPLDPALARGGDAGRPLILAESPSPARDVLRELTRQVAERLPRSMYPPVPAADPPSSAPPPPDP